MPRGEGFRRLDNDVDVTVFVAVERDRVSDGAKFLITGDFAEVFCCNGYEVFTIVRSPNSDSRSIYDTITLEDASVEREKV